MEEFLSLCETDVGTEVQVANASTIDSLDGTTVTSLSKREGASVLSSSDSLDVAKSCFGEVSSLDPSEIQKEIERLMQLKHSVIEQARSTVFDSEAAKNIDTSSHKSGLRVVNLNFEGSSQSDQSCSSQQTRKSIGDEESDDEFVDNKKELNEVGKLLQKQLNKQEQKEESRRERISYMSTQPIKKAHDITVSKTEPKQKLDSPTAFDSFFQIRIRNPKVSSSTFESYIEGIKKLRISLLKSSSIPKDGFVTVGVIVNREIRKSASGKDFVIWNLHDLKNCQDKCARLLLFGDAYKEYWKLQVGACVALVNPQIADDNRPDAEKKFKSNFTGVTMKVFRRAEVLELGYSSDLGMCKGVKFGGEKCSNFVNTSLSEYCVYHVMNEARKLSAKRGTFNSVTSQPPIKRSANPIFLGPHKNTKFNAVASTAGMAPYGMSGAMRPITSVVFLPSEHKKTTKVEEKAVLQEIIHERAYTPGARNMVAIAESKTGLSSGKPMTAENQFSMSDFIKIQEDSKPKPTLHSPKLGFGLRAGQEINLAVRKADAAKLRAVAILKKGRAESLLGKKAVKRQNDQQAESGTALKQSKLTPLENEIDLDKLLERKSIYANEANKAHALAAQKHLDMLEHQEKLETFVTDCMSVKNVKVVSCKKCDYIAQRQSDMCMKEGHTVKYTTAEKRFFKCGSCKKRTTVFALLPTKPCKYCNAKEWARVAMKDERIVKLENEQLMVRGEERKFVNT